MPVRATDEPGIFFVIKVFTWECKFLIQVSLYINYWRGLLTHKKCNYHLHWQPGSVLPNSTSLMPVSLYSHNWAPCSYMKILAANFFQFSRAIFRSVSHKWKFPIFFCQKTFHASQPRPCISYTRVFSTYMYIWAPLSINKKLFALIIGRKN